MIVDGKAITKDILEATRKRVAALGRAVTVEAIVVAPAAATESYLKVKTARASDAGMTLVITRLPDDATTEDIIAAARASKADALIVQLPLPFGINTQAVLDAIPPEKDADVLSQAARKRFEAGEADALMPPVVGAIKEIFVRHGVDANGKKAVVVGTGWLVGQPAAIWLARQGARVSALTRSTERFSETILNSDIIVSGAGSPGIIGPGILKAGAVVIDAGTSESGGAIVGDANPAGASIASVFTPVPGGVGPIAVACLFQNAAALAERVAMS